MKKLFVPPLLHFVSIFMILICFHIPAKTAVQSGPGSSYDTSFSITPDYDSLLNISIIADAIIWEDGSGSHVYNDWTTGQKSDLLDLLNGMDTGTAFAIENPPLLADDKYFSNTEAWMIYLTHAAHALWLDAHRVVNWYLTDFTADQLALLLDSRTLVKYDGEDKYCFDAYNGLGRVTDWNIRFSYDFMKEHGFIKSSQLETVNAFSHWCRTYLTHISGSMSNPDGYETLYGYRGFPLVDRILTMGTFLQAAGVQPDFSVRCCAV